MDATARTVEGGRMTYLSIAVIILAVITAFTFGLVTGEDIAKERHDFWNAVFTAEENDDDEYPADDW